MSLLRLFKESCGCDHKDKKDETSTTGAVAPTHYPVGYDDSEDKEKLKEDNDWDDIFEKFKKEIEKALDKQQ